MTPPPEHFEPDDASPGAIPEMQVEERRASVTLRQDDAREARVASMAAAHRSLAEALRLIHRLILLVMIALVALFFLSGFRQINETERGVRLLFGKAVSSELSPGFRFSWPRPMGDIKKVDVSQQTVLVHRAFYPEVSGRNEIRSIRELGIGSYMLDPKVSGSVITGDVALAHLRLNIDYQIDNPVAFLENIGDDATASRIVASVAQQAAVRVVAETTIDELLLRRGSAPPPEVVPAEPGAGENEGAATPEGEPASPPAAEAAAAAPTPSNVEIDIEFRMRELAQESMDAMNSGIRIARIAIFEAAPPAKLTGDFDKVQKSRYEATLTIDRAKQVYEKTLNSAAGAAYRPMLALIDKYGRDLDAGRQTEADTDAETIFGLMRGDYAEKRLVVDGTDYGLVRLSGDAAKSISQAQEYRFSTRKQAEEVASTFRAKLTQYRANPEVFVAREWSEAMRAFAARPYVDVFMLPNDTSDLTLQLNADPDIVREIQRALQRRRIEDNLEFRAAQEAGEIAPSRPER